MDNPTRPGATSVPVSAPPLPGRTETFSDAEHGALMKRVSFRLIPLLFLCYVIAYIDRINVGFAKLHMREVLGVNEAVFNSVYGRGAGLFFIGYFLFEVPSNLILQRVGARIWIARIMVLWGLVSMGFMFVKGVPAFYVMRFLLGAAEAGFFPGVILYLTYWYPASERSRMVAWFALGGVMAGAVGFPVSGVILDKLHKVAGVAGWQWLFLLEAIPAVLMGLVVLWILPDGPLKARWLSERERSWIQSRLIEEARHAVGQSHHLRDVFASGRVWLLCLIYFLLNIGSYGFELWSPTIVKELAANRDAVVGFIGAIPYVVAGVVMLLVGRHSDSTGERRGHVAVSAMVAAAAFAFAAKSGNPWWAMAGLSLAFAGLKSTLGPFWAMTTGFLSGTAAAGGIALINSVGNLGGYVGPDLVGVIKDKTGSNVVPLLLLAGSLLGMGLCALAVPVKHRGEKTGPEKS